MAESVVVALDAMGGDHGPGVVVDGAVKFFRESSRKTQKNVKIVLVGHRDTISRMLSSAGGQKYPIEIEHASQVISMDDHPAEALKQKPDSSMVVMANLQRQGIANAMVSPGNTGAMMASSMFALGRIKGISRPALASTIPTIGNPTILVDVGANVGCRPQLLYKFAFMGSIYSKLVFGVDKPKVSLLNVGSEPSKGPPDIKEVYKMLSRAPLNFAGNIEGNGILMGDADVVVCDGYTGNVLVKFIESIASMVGGTLYLEMKKQWTSRMGYLFMKPSFNKLWKKFDAAEYGGAPLLGLNGVAIVAHGSSSALAIRNAVAAACDFRRSGAVEAIRDKMAELMEEEKAVE
ncbi:phosphate acyltransferase PlsX [Candidatus Fermentibacteria bacterium]|nr:MAG: phosphate acyltransferase PlsX [Candidatus Fermentibacteria bacterium]